MEMETRSSVQMNDVQKQFKEVTDEVAALADMLREIAASKGEDVRAAAGERLEEVARRAQSLAEKARSKTQSELSSLEQKITEKPVQSALIAFVIGLLLGILTRR
jgi:ElaB/YqjD/DUF883 family membrane-anchored ribosome-binding protein